ncbi:MAG: hypothetical protein Unbinned2514contig1001_40 [Prokaryotic dsDNA virus sp.]|nr:MAG: hypothetical protein Unbinned2514contig1001_40 [Prokaryotic dsDNA virus sp.]|tara:strand:- start:9461 stop:9649 length:189 start_codon:yes stop_codon:yes gene_type:complete
MIKKYTAKKNYSESKAKIDILLGKNKDNILKKGGTIQLDDAMVTKEMKEVIEEVKESKKGDK